MSSSMKTPLGQVRGLGSAKEGAGHFVGQRVSAIAMLFLVPWFLYSLIGAAGAGYEGAVAWVAQPVNAILVILTLGAAFYHMRLGMQVVIEDYISKSGTKIALLILNTFVPLLLFVASVYSVLRIGLAG